MIATTSQDAFSAAWVRANITNPIHALVILRNVIPWERIETRLAPYYHATKGRLGKPIRLLVALLLAAKWYALSDRGVVARVKENRYLQYFCNVPNTGLQTFLHPTSLVKFRQRLGEEGIAVVEEEVFLQFRRAGVIQADMALLDSSVLPNDIIYPNDVHLIVKAFKKMKQCAKLHKIAVWWDEADVKRLWRAFGLAKGANRVAWLEALFDRWLPALITFQRVVESLSTTPKRRAKAHKLLRLLWLLEEQTLQKLNGETQIPHRIVSLDEPDARPIKKGKVHPACEFGSTVQMSFTRQGFMVTVENFIGSPHDSTLFPETLAKFRARMRKTPDAVVTDLGFRSTANFTTAAESPTVFLGRTADVPEAQQARCCQARSATEGFIAVAKHLHGFGRSLYRGFAGDRIWSLLCQAVSNLKKFMQLWAAEKVSEASLEHLGLL
jgi:IS5 family transposase